MNDRDLLEAAARAAGIDLEWDGPPELWCAMYYERKTYHGWNPLTDDGDALRLAVKMRMNLMIYADETVAIVSRNVSREEYDADPYAATRRAIVRAAAAMAKDPK